MAQRGRRNANELLLMALACGATIEAAGQKAGLSRSTVLRRMKDPEFKGRLEEIRTEMVQRTSGALTASAMEAVRTLMALQQPSVPHATRLGAARTILELGIKMREITDLEARLTAVEDHLGVVASL